MAEQEYRCEFHRECPYSGPGKCNGHDSRGRGKSYEQCEHRSDWMLLFPHKFAALEAAAAGGG